MGMPATEGWKSWNGKGAAFISSTNWSGEITRY